MMTDDAISRSKRTPEPATPAAAPSAPAPRPRRWTRWLIAAVLATQAVNVAAFWGVWRQRGARATLATVNGEPILQKDLDNELNSLYGAEELTRVIHERAILSAAAKRGVLPSEADVEDALDLLYAEQPDMVEQLASRRLSERMLRDDLRGRLALRNLRVQPIQVTDAEVEQFYTDNRAQFVQHPRVVAELVIVPDPGTIEAAQEMLRQGLTAELVASSLDGSLPDTAKHRVVITAGVLDPEAEARVMALAPGGVSEAISFAEGPGVLRVLEKRERRQLSFEEARDDASIAVRLTRAPLESVTLERILDAAEVTVDSDRYRDPVLRWLFPTQWTRMASDG